MLGAYPNSSYQKNSGFVIIYFDRFALQGVADSSPVQGSTAQRWPKLFFLTSIVIVSREQPTSFFNLVYLPSFSIIYILVFIMEL